MRVQKGVVSTLQCRRDGELSAGRKAEWLAVRIPHPAAAYGRILSSSVRRSRFYGLPNTEGGKIFMNLYRTPLSPAYWREAGASFRSVKVLVFAALMIAAANVLASQSIYVTADTKFSLGFLARSLSALVCGPVAMVIYGVAEDLLGYAIAPSGVFFPGYTLSTVAGVLIYALCFYRARITVARIVVANVLVNVFVNAVMGSWWNVILKGNFFWFYFSTSIVKNLVTLVPKCVLMFVLFQALVPALQRLGYLPRQVNGRIRLFGWGVSEAEPAGKPK